jgi:hypothetical protein
MAAVGCAAATHNGVRDAGGDAAGEEASEADGIAGAAQPWTNARARDNVRNLRNERVRVTGAG